MAFVSKKGYIALTVVEVTYQTGGVVHSTSKHREVKAKVKGYSFWDVMV